jgi:hypothetical protein
MPVSDSAPSVTARHYKQALDTAVVQWSTPGPDQQIATDNDGCKVYTLAQLRAEAAKVDHAQQGRLKAEAAMRCMHLAYRKAQNHAGRVNACRSPLSQRAARRTAHAIRYSRQLRAEQRTLTAAGADPVYLSALGAACNRAEQLASKAMHRLAAATATEQRTHHRILAGHLAQVKLRTMTQAEHLQHLQQPATSDAYTPVHPCHVGVMGSVQAQNAPPGAALQINKEHRLIP